MRKGRRLTLALVCGSLLMVGSSATALAECFPRPEPGTGTPRTFVFTATVTKVVTGQNQDYVDAGEGDAVDWSADLDVTRVFRGSVADRLGLHGTTRPGEQGSGCSYFLGDQVVVGDQLFIALDEQIDFETNDALFGNLLLWHRVDDRWAFYADALQDGDDRMIYPREVREARTTAQVLAVVAALAPDTSVVPAVDGAPETPPFTALVVTFLAGLALSMRRLRRQA